MLGAACILMGLLHRRRSGEGLYVENPQLNATMSHMAHIVRRTDGEVLGAGRLDPMQYGFGPCERLYETADGWVCLVAREADEVRGLEKLVGFAPGTGDDDAVAGRLADIFATRSTSDLLGELRGAGVPAVEPVGRNSGAFLRDPENRRTGRVAECLHPTKGYVRETAQLLRVSPAAVVPHRLAPDLGAQTDAILDSLGFSADAVAAWREGGAIR
jgi:crotonobetainyl-CoA:carnitine CoA-transferase CaiB-like acyl-CoA transferase